MPTGVPWGLLAGVLACLAAGAPAAAAAEMARPAEAEADELALRWAEAQSRALAVVARRVRPSVVNITVQRTQYVAGQGYSDSFGFFEDFFLGSPLVRRPPRPMRTQTMGSGVIVSTDGYILTNTHVVLDADRIEVKLLDGRVLPAALVGTDRDTDVAVVKIDETNLPALSFADSDACQVGETVLAVGNPFGFDFTVTSGIISGLGRRTNTRGLLHGETGPTIEDYIQTDAAINPGNSGGPLVNLRGEILGVNTAIYSRSGGSQGVSFAIPANVAKYVMQALIAHERISDAYLGAKTQALTPDLARAFGLETPRGAFVTTVAADSPAARAGLRRGDVIVRFGARVVEDDTALRNFLATTPPGETVELGLIRRREEIAVSVVVEAKPEALIFEGVDKLLDALGVVEMVPLTPELARQIGYPQGLSGVLVYKANERSPTRPTVLPPGAIIYRVDRTDVATPEELRAAIAAVRRQGTIYVRIGWREIPVPFKIPD